MHDHDGKRLTNVGHRGQQGAVRVWRDLFLQTLFQDGNLQRRLTNPGKEWCGFKVESAYNSPMNGELSVRGGDDIT